MNPRIRELQNTLDAQIGQLAKINARAKKADGSYDYLQCEEFEHFTTQEECWAVMEQKEAELEKTEHELKTLEKMDEQTKRLEAKARERREIDTPIVHSRPTDGRGMAPAYQQVMSLGQMFAKGYPNRDNQTTGTVRLEKDFRDYDVKALMQTTAGWAPESIRIPRVAEFAAPPVQVIDVFPVQTTDQASITWMEQTVQTNAAAEVAEAAALAESTIEYVERLLAIRKIGTYIRVTDEQLADVAQVQGIIDSQLRYMVRKRLDIQVLVGNGTPPNIMGLVNFSGLQTQAVGAESAPDAIYMAMDKVRTIAFADPTTLIIHPNNWQKIRLTTNESGQYPWGPPTDTGVARIWGIPVVLSTALTPGTAVVGDFTTYSTLWMRQGVEVAAGFIQDEFVKGINTIKATLRGALQVLRPAAFCLITGLP